MNETKLTKAARCLFALDAGGVRKDGYREPFSRLSAPERQYWVGKARRLLEMLDAPGSAGRKLGERP